MLKILLWVLGGFAGLVVTVVIIGLIAIVAVACYRVAKGTDHLTLVEKEMSSRSGSPDDVIAGGEQIVAVLIKPKKKWSLFRNNKEVYDTK